MTSSQTPPDIDPTSTGLHAWTPSELEQLRHVERENVACLATRCPRSGQLALTRCPAPSGDPLILTIGRGPEVDVDLTGDPEVSRSHCRIERIGGSWVISDDGLSRNGTFVNSRRTIGQQRLADRDLIRCGQTLIVFRNPVEANLTATSPSDGPFDRHIASQAQLRVLESLARPCLGGDRFVPPASNKEIAEALFISVDTVKSHLRALFGMFGLNDIPQNRKRAKLVEQAISAGLIRETAAKGETSGAIGRTSS